MSLRATLRRFGWDEVLAVSTSKNTSQVAFSEHSFKAMSEQGLEEHSEIALNRRRMVHNTQRYPSIRLSVEGHLILFVFIQLLFLSHRPFQATFARQSAFFFVGFMNPSIRNSARLL